MWASESFTRPQEGEFCKNRPRPGDSHTWVGAIWIYYMYIYVYIYICIYIHIYIDV